MSLILAHKLAWVKLPKNKIKIMFREKYLLLYLQNWQHTGIITDWSIEMALNIVKIQYSGITNWPL